MTKVLSVILPILIFLLDAGPSQAQPTRKPIYSETNGVAHTNHPRYRGVVGHWIMNETGGLTAYDISANGNHGTLTNGPVWTQGQFGQAISFDGVDDYVRTSANNLYDSLQTGTISVWFKLTTTLAEYALVSYSTIADDHSLIFWGVSSTGKLVTYWKSSNAQWPEIDATTVINDTQWHHATFTADGSTRVKIYLDGKEETTTWIPGGTGAESDFIADVGLIGSYDHFTEIGAFHRQTGSWGFFNGLIDDVRIYNRALSADEVMSLYTDPFLEFYSTMDDQP